MISGAAAFTLAMVLFVFGVVAGFGAGYSDRRPWRRNLKQEALDHGFAEYNPKTGEWQWKAPRL